MSTNRRTFLKMATVAPLSLSFELHGNETRAAGRIQSAQSPLTKIGRVRIKTPAEIGSSPFGIGCETLDRDLWKPKEVYPFIENLPVGWARLQTGWGRVEKEKGNYDWAWLDESVDGLVKMGIKPFFNVGYGNTLYTEGEVGFHPLDKPEALEAWKRFITALVQRYKDRINHYELWNEPNLGGFWAPDKPNPAKYVRLVRETAPLIRGRQANAVIIGGVVSRLPYYYVSQLFKEGLGELIDIFSFHPYGTIPESYTDRIKALKTLVHQHNPAIKIWQGENGYPSQPGGTGFQGDGPWTENIQAKNMLRRLIIDCSLELSMTLWFLIVDIHDYPKGSGKVNYKGILRAKPTVSPKPAYPALQHLGSLIYGEVRAGNALINLMAAGQELSDKDYEAFGNGEKKNLEDTTATLLYTENGKVLAYWATGKAVDEMADLNHIHLFLWDWEGDGFKEPVLVDPFLGDVFALSANQRMFDNDRFRVNQEAQVWQQLPLRDYPLFIMEKEQAL